MCFGIFKVFNSSKTNLSSIIDFKNKIRNEMALNKAKGLNPPNNKDGPNQILSSNTQCQYLRHYK
jgi:hypothetical protein